MKLDNSGLERFAKALREDHELLFSDNLRDEWADDIPSRAGPAFWLVLLVIALIVLVGVIL